MAFAKPVTDHETVRRWIEERDGHPVAVRSGSARSSAGIHGRGKIKH
jgi:hypothetical protein